MKNLPIAVVVYKEKLDNCIAKINRAISAHTAIKRELEAYKTQISILKATVIKESTNQRENQDLLNQLAFLENSAFELINLTDDALLSAIGRLGLNLDELRSTNESLQKTTNQDSIFVNSKLTTSILEKCQQDVDETCRRLLACCKFDASILKAMGISAIR